MLRGFICSTEQKVFLRGAENVPPRSNKDLLRGAKKIYSAEQKNFLRGAKKNSSTEQKKKILRRTKGRGAPRALQQYLLSSIKKQISIPILFS